MRVRGEVFSGAMRGAPLIEKYYPRLIGLVGFRPFKGTMDVRLERSVDIRPFSSKTMDHVLMGGRRIVNAHLARVKVRKFSKLYALMDVRTKQEEIVKNAKALWKNAGKKFSIKGSDDVSGFHSCWAVQFKGGIYRNDVVELICDCELKQALNIDDGDTVEIEFSSAGKKGGRLPEPAGIKAGSEAMPERSNL